MRSSNPLSALRTNTYFIMSSNSDIQQSFTTFERLPIEIRLKIWQLALCKRRFITEIEVSFDRIHPYRSPLPIFYANWQSRGEAIQFLTSFHFFPSTTLHTTVYIHPRTDILYLNEGSTDPQDDENQDLEYIDDVTLRLCYLANSLSDEDRAKVQHLAIDMNEWGDLDEPHLLSKHISRFLGLKTLVIVLGAYFDRRRPMGDKLSLVILMQRVTRAKIGGF